MNQPSFQYPNYSNPHQSNPNHPNPIPLNRQLKNNLSISQQQYFSSLKHYKPILYLNQGNPLFLWNQGWFKSFLCILILDGILIFSFLVFIVNGNHINTNNNNTYRHNINMRHMSDNIDYITNNNDYNNIYHLSQLFNKHTQFKNTLPNTQLFTFVTTLTLLLINISYFLCQFLNPGIQHPRLILQQLKQQQQQQNNNNKSSQLSSIKQCKKCNIPQTSQMTHCRQCQICVWGLDHHCGFFNKCIAGYQKYAFYLFIVSIFIAFVEVLVYLGMAIDI